jgi:hypothetical protein
LVSEEETDEPLAELEEYDDLLSPQVVASCDFLILEYLIVLVEGSCVDGYTVPLAVV